MDWFNFIETNKLYEDYKSSVYLVGSQESLSKFNELVPAPNETYTTLFTPYDYSDIDASIRNIREAEKQQNRVYK